MNNTDPGCTKFTRSKAACPSSGLSDQRQQINTLSSYIDASMVYSNEQHVTNSLRAFDGEYKVELKHFIYLATFITAIKKFCKIKCLYIESVRKKRLINNIQ